MALATQEEGDIMDNKCFYNVTAFTQETIGESNDFKLILTNQEKLVCLREILGRLKKVLYVYDKGLEDPKYNYKVFCGGILIYVSSSNTLFEGELVNLVINLNAIINNDFDKKQVKRIIFECINQAEYLIDKHKEYGIEEK